ncbi:MAG: hypothetical protein WCT20_00565, partial [Candidatus Babeliales bacterium]
MKEMFASVRRVVGFVVIGFVGQVLFSGTIAAAMVSDNDMSWAPCVNNEECVSDVEMRLRERQLEAFDVLVVWGISCAGKTSFINKVRDAIGKDIFKRYFARIVMDSFKKNEIEKMSTLLDEKKYYGKLAPVHFLVLDAIEDALQRKYN